MKTNLPELVISFREFIKSLATFNKPIVAGVQGAAIGLGVTMLPLFDLVIASDKATFCTPYGKLGQIAEGAAIFTLSHILGSAIVCLYNKFYNYNIRKNNVLCLYVLHLCVLLCDRRANFFWLGGL